MGIPPFEVLRPEQLRRRTSIKWQYHGPDVLPVWVAEMDVLPAPEVVEALTEAVRSGDTGYPNFGTTYKEALAEFAQTRWDWQPDPADMALCADVMTGIRVLIERFCPAAGHGRHPESGLSALRGLQPGGGSEGGAGRAHGRGPARCGCDRRGPGREPDRCRLPSHGAAPVQPAQPDRESSTPPRSWRQFAGSAQRRGALVIVDEVHAPLVPEGATFVPWFAVADHGFVVTSAAKAFNLAGLKAGLIVSGPSRRRPS